MAEIVRSYDLRLRSFLRGCVAVLVLVEPALGDVAPASLTAIADALREGRALEAEAMATQMLAAKDPVPVNNAYLLLDRGLAREQLGHREGAARDFSAAIESKTLPRGELARALFDRGVTLDELGRTEAAIADYSKALELVPRYATALNNRGNAYRRIGKYSLARTDYEAAIASGDDEPEYPLYGLGRVAEAQGDPAMAKSYYRKALAANAQFAPASQRMASMAEVPSDGSYALRAPGSGTAQRTSLRKPQPERIAAGNEGSSEPPVTSPAPNAASDRSMDSKPDHGAADTGDVDLRPAIVEGEQKSRVQKPHKISMRIASTAPAGPSDAPSGTEMVQLGAWRSQGDAALGWNRAAVDAGDLLGGATPHIVEVDVPGKGHFWRLRTEVPAGTSAAEFCTQLKAKGLSCIVAKS